MNYKFLKLLLFDELKFTKYCITSNFQIQHIFIKFFLSAFIRILKL